MKKIMIIGSPGSGKTTLSLKLASITGLPLVHLDKLFWRDNWTHVSREDFDTQLFKAVSQKEWIIDGNYGRTLDVRLNYADTVIFLDYNRFVCLFRVFKRTLLSFGKSRFDMGDGCPERFDFSFMKYVWNFDKNSIYKKLNEIEDKNVIIIKNNSSLKKFLKEL